MNNFITYFLTNGWKIFAISFVSVFIMVLLQQLGFRTPQLIPSTIKLISPLHGNYRIIESLIPKLEVKTPDFRLTEAASLITKAYAGEDYDQAAAYGVIDLDTGTVVLEKNINKELPIASLTKLMTAIVALDLAKPNEQFTVSENAPQVIPTRLTLTPGEKFTLDELLNASLLTSANDCTQVIAEGIENKYGDKLFVDAMNAKARFLGLKHTRFTNPQGFDDAHSYSTIEDYALLTHYALKNYPLITEIVQKDHEILPVTVTHSESYLNNWQSLIGVYPGAIGVKIGNTEAAGHTTAVVAQREGKEILVIVLGAPGILQRDKWAADLLDYGFKNLSGLYPVHITYEQLEAKYATWKYFH